MLTAALIAVGLLAALLAVMLGNRARELRESRAQGESLRLETEARAGHDALLRRLAESMHEGLAVERDGIRLANARFAELCGAASAAELVGRSLTDLVHPDFAELLAGHLRRQRAGQQAPSRLEVEMSRSDGGVGRVELSFEPVAFDGAPSLLVAAAEMSPVQLREASPRMHSSALDALDALGEGVITTDLGGRIVYVNRAAEELVGHAAQDAVGRTLPEVLDLVEESDRRSLGDPVRQCLTTGARVNIGRRGMAVAGSGEGERSIELSVSPVRDAAGAIVGTVIALRDVSDLRGLTRQMSYQASHDALTGLVNRREFERRLQETLDDAHGSGSRHVLCYLDLDRFKAVNDECGHTAGDNMLREVAGLIKEGVRDSDTVGRLGGDEFGVLLAGCPLEKARQIADDIVRTTGDYRFVWKDKIFTIGVSVGLVEISRESGTLEDTIGAADSACYVAKRQGGHVHVYSARDEAAARSRGEIQWLQRLQSALRDGRFELYAQPIVAVDEQAGVGPGLEVLLRLRDEAGTAVTPSEFMVAAERYRLMPHVDRWVVQTALAAFARGVLRLAPGRSLCINLSGQTLGDGSFLEFVVECLDRTGVAPDRVCFEVTENSVITNIDHARRFIGVLHGMGCQFALDDFGRGLSSFANLKNLQLDYLKIDGYFIRNLATDSVNQAMVTAMIKLARSLNFQVIAEHVEDTTALESARRMGVDYLQGWQMGRPQPLPIAS